MRLYSTQFVTRNFLGSRRSTAACPFPGKYPLRLLWTKEDRSVGYHGKFHGGIWRQICRQDIPASFYLIYDRAGSVLWSTGRHAFNMQAPHLTYRYFGATWLNGSLLGGVEPEKLGNYWMYRSRSIMSNGPAAYIRQVNSTPHVRSI